MRFEQFSNKYWFCCLTTDEAGFDKLISLQQYSIMEQSAPMDFLAAHGLKVCK